MCDPRPPLFVFSDDLVSFESTEDLLRYVEPIDVDDDMRAFDADGRELMLRAGGVKRRGIVAGGGTLKLVDVTASEHGRDPFNRLLREHAGSLRQVLGDRWTSDIEVETAPLFQLVDAVHRWTRST